MAVMRVLRLLLVLIASLALDAGHPLAAPWAEGLEESEEVAHLRGARRLARAPGPAVAPRTSYRPVHLESSRPAPNLPRTYRGLRAPAVEVQKLPPPQSEAPSSPDDH
jgi:hypothetical protein